MATDFAGRYARAFAQVASAAHLDLLAAQRQLEDFAATFAGSPQLREVLMDPSIPADQKLRVIDGIASRLQMPREVRNFVAVIMSHGRLHELPQILAEYAALADSGSGLTEVEIVTARAIGQEERTALEEKAAELAGTHIRTTYSENASLLGGAVLKIGSTVYDGSLRAQLEGMRQALAGVPLA